MINSPWVYRLRQLALDLEGDHWEVLPHSFDEEITLQGGQMNTYYTSGQRTVLLRLRSLDPPPRKFRPLLLLPDEYLEEGEQPCP